MTYGGHMPVGYTDNDHGYVVPLWKPPVPAHEDATDDFRIVGIEEAVDRLNREAEEGVFCAECRGHGTHNFECPRVRWVCCECGSKHGECGIATWHLGVCDMCGEHKDVTEARDFKSRAKVESCPQDEDEGFEGILTVAQHHMDAAQALLELACLGGRTMDELKAESDAIFDKVRHPDEWPSTLRDRFSMLTAEAVDAVAGPRNEVYGEPRFDMSATAEMMNGYLHKRGLLPADQFLQPFDVPALLMTVKLARLAGQPGHHDSQVDMIGWTGVYQECAA